MSWSNRGRGRGMGGQFDIGDEEWSPAPLGSRVQRNLEKMGVNKPAVVARSHENQSADDYFLDEDPQLKKAMEESLKTAQEDAAKRQSGTGKREKSMPDLFSDVLSEDDNDEDYDPKTEGKKPKNKFVTSSQPSKTKATAGRSKVQGATAKGSKSTISSSDQTAGDKKAETKSKIAQSKVISGPSRTGDSGSGDKFMPGKVQTDLDDLFTKPKVAAKSFAEAASATTKKSATKEQHGTEDTEDGKDSASMEVPPNMRFNPFTFRMEPRPNFKRLETPLPPDETNNPLRMVLPNDFEVDKDGKVLKTPSEVVRAWEEYMGDQYRQRREQFPLVTRPTKTVTYREGEYLGTKSRNLTGDSDLCKWQERNFPDGGGLDEDQRKWVIEHRAYLKELAEKKKQEDAAAGGKSD